MSSAFESYPKDDEYDGDVSLQPSLHDCEAAVNVYLPDHHPDVRHLNRETTTLNNSMFRGFSACENRICTSKVGLPDSKYERHSSE
jgi:hypothetical protein